jgi:hypothetical protein
MTKGGGEGVDTAAVRDAVERAVGLMEEVRRIKQQLTASKTSIDKAAEIVTAMADGVRGQLAEISGLLDRAEAAAAQDGEDDDAATEPDARPAAPAVAPAPEPAPAPPAPRLRDELAGVLPGQSSLL